MPMFNVWVPVVGARKPKIYAVPPAPVFDTWAREVIDVPFHEAVKVSFGVESFANATTIRPFADALIVWLTL